MNAEEEKEHQHTRSQASPEWCSFNISVCLWGKMWPLIELVKLIFDDIEISCRQQSRHWAQLENTFSLPGILYCRQANHPTIEPHGAWWVHKFTLTVASGTFDIPLGHKRFAQPPFALGWRGLWLDCRFSLWATWMWHPATLLMTARHVCQVR